MNQSAIIMWATTVIAITAIVNIIVTFCMWKISSRALKHSEKVFSLTNRPYLGITSASISFTDEKDINPFIHFSNFGILPAKNIFFRWILMVNNKEIFSEINPEKDFVLKPGESSQWGDTIFKDSFNKSMINANKSFKLIIQVSYDTIGDNHYETKDIYEYNIQNHKFIKVFSQWD